eukprot:UN28511
MIVTCRYLLVVWDIMVPFHIGFGGVFLWASVCISLLLTMLLTSDDKYVILCFAYFTRLNEDRAPEIFSTLFAIYWMVGLVSMLFWNSLCYRSIWKAYVGMQNYMEKTVDRTLEYSYVIQSIFLFLFGYPSYLSYYYYILIEYQPERI